jgi:cation diffusion facilitator CzcD-associated flavoprotein CzcO
VPEIAKIASNMTVCQRSPAWVIPRHDTPIPQWQRSLLKYCPPIRWRYRASAMDIRESFFKAVTQPTSSHAQHMRDLNQMLLDTQLDGRPDLQAKLRPSYSPGCKRSVISDDYYPALARPNVTLETSKIEHFTRTGIKFADQDVAQEFDVVILATGFESMAFLAPMRITGRHGVPLDKLWAGAAHAYRGVMVPQLPNFGILYGPNTNLSHNSLILMIEAQVRYLSQVIATVLDARVDGKTLAIEPKADVTGDYNEKLQKELQATSFADPGCNSWWKREDGHIINNWSGTAVDYQQSMSQVDWDDYQKEGTGQLKTTPTKIGRVVEETQVSNLVLGSVVVAGLGALGMGLGGFLAKF